MQESCRFRKQVESTQALQVLINDGNQVANNIKCQLNNVGCTNCHSGLKSAVICPEWQRRFDNDVNGNSILQKPWVWQCMRRETQERVYIRRSQPFVFNAPCFPTLVQIRQSTNVSTLSCLKICSPGIM